MEWTGILKLLNFVTFHTFECDLWLLSSSHGSKFYACTILTLRNNWKVVLVKEDKRLLAVCVLMRWVNRVCKSADPLTLMAKSVDPLEK